MVLYTHQNSLTTYHFMETENEQAQVEDVVEQEEQTSQEEYTETESQDEETVTIPKSKFKAIDRKARAYDSTLKSDRPKFTTGSDAKWKQKMELNVKGYDDTESDFILKNGGVKALEDPFVASAIETMREKKRAEKAMVEGEGQKSAIDKRFTPEAFSKLTNSEQIKVLSELN